MFVLKYTHDPLAPVYWLAEWGRSSMLCYLGFMRIVHNKMYKVLGVEYMSEAAAAGQWRAGSVLLPAPPSLYRLTWRPPSHAVSS